MKENESFFSVFPCIVHVKLKYKTHKAICSFCDDSDSDCYCKAGYISLFVLL